ncbi:MAG: GIY-YIG nuclease family protein [Steroidobacteraceae bacterium]
MKKQHILDEIRRTATSNGGAALGKRGFEAATGIKESDWSGRFWARWSDAVREAGLTPNTLRPKSDDEVLFAELGACIRELGRYPTVPEMRMRKRLHPAFPNEKVLVRLGSREEIVRQLVAFCGQAADWADVVAICNGLAFDSHEPNEESGDDLETGYVYLALMKVGREKRYKVGKADIVERRKRQIGPHLPEELELVHTISTDDAYGIEAYWHNRFAEKRRGGEWFELCGADVKAFKRRKFM